MFSKRAIQNINCLLINQEKVAFGYPLLQLNESIKEHHLYFSRFT